MDGISWKNMFEITRYVMYGNYKNTFPKSKVWGKTFYRVACPSPAIYLPVGVELSDIVSS